MGRILLVEGKRWLILVKSGEKIGQLVRRVFAADRCTLASGRCALCVASSHLCSGHCKLVQWLRDLLEWSLRTPQRSLGVFRFLAQLSPEQTAIGVADAMAQRSLRMM